MKKYLFGILAITMAVGFSAFTTKNAQKPFTAVEYFYNPASGKILIGVTTPANPLSLVEAQVKDVDNWTDDKLDFGISSSLAQIEFDQETTADGANDGQMTKQEAVNAVWNYYIAHFAQLPSNGSFFVEGFFEGIGTGTIVAVHRVAP